ASKAVNRTRISFCASAGPGGISPACVREGLGVPARSSPSDLNPTPRGRTGLRAGLTRGMTRTMPGMSSAGFHCQRCKMKTIATALCLLLLYVTAARAGTVKVDKAGDCKATVGDEVVFAFPYRAKGMSLLIKMNGKAVIIYRSTLSFNKPGGDEITFVY